MVIWVAFELAVLRDAPSPSCNYDGTWPVLFWKEFRRKEPSSSAWHFLPFSQYDTRCAFSYTSSSTPSASSATSSEQPHPSCALSGQLETHLLPPHSSHTVMSCPQAPQIDIEGRGKDNVHYPLRIMNYQQSTIDNKACWLSKASVLIVDCECIEKGPHNLFGPFSHSRLSRCFFFAFFCRSFSSFTFCRSVFAAAATAIRTCAAFFTAIFYFFFVTFRTIHKK